MLQKLSTFISHIKKLIFEFTFVVHHNSITNKHLLVVVEVLQLFPLVYFYFNPIYSQLHNFSMFRLFLDAIWPQIFLFTEGEQFLVTLTFLLVFPAIFFTILMMKLILGYQYLIILAMEVWLLIYPVIFVKFGIEMFNIVIGFQEYRAIGVLLALVHAFGTVMAFNLHNKKYKLLDLLPILLIYCNVNEYAVLSIVIVRLILSYFISPNTLIKPLRMRIQVSLLLIIIFAYFSADNLTNYISFVLLLSVFSLTEVLSIIRNYNSFESIFYYLENSGDEDSDSRLRYYDFVEDHRINCESINCMCRQLGKYKDDEEIKKKGYQFVEKLYAFKEDFMSRIELGEVSCERYEYTLAGLLMLLELKPQSLRQEYLLYYIKTKYEQEYRKHDKNYTFGQEYHNAYQDLRGFQQQIENLTMILKQFWLTILHFDGSKKFLFMILNISEKITQIRTKYDEYIDKYEEFSNNFKYLYKTFEIAILNLLDNEKEQSTRGFGIVKQEIHIKVPERQLFFVSNSNEKITNCNREFCNLVEIDKQDLVGRSYSGFVPKTCSDEHSGWVKDWYENYNREEDAKQSIKPIRLMSSYTKAIKMQNKILPRFDNGIEIITFIKMINKLEHSSLHKGSSQISSEPSQQVNSSTEDIQPETFFSFYIQKKSMRIVGMDDAFFETTMIDQSDELKKKILHLKLNEMFPKVVMMNNNHQNNQNLNSNREKQSTVVSVSDNCREAMLNYSVLEEFTQCKEKNFAMNTLANSSKNNLPSSINFPKSANNLLATTIIQQDDDRLSFARKSRKKLSMISNNSGYNNHIKETIEQVFLYEIIEQKNINLEVEYCLVNFKLKKNIVLDVETKYKENSKKRMYMDKDKVKEDPNKQLQLNGADEENNVEDEQQGHLIINKQSQYPNANFMANLSHREPFIRSSKPYKQQTNATEIENKKAEIEESEEFNNEQKNYCLPWPILFPLFVVHLIYMHISTAYEGTFLYLQQAFNFYDMYDQQIMKRVNIPFNYDANYIQELKELWIKGYGFYHSSILTFQNPSDPYFVTKLYDEVISQYHYGIYLQIQAQLENQKDNLQLYFRLIISILSLFLLYVTVDFILNIRYCFKISNNVTQIILIFLNISELDINKLIYSISRYQNQVLQMVNFAQIEEEKKIQREDYKIDQMEARQMAELSGIGLLKEEPYGFCIQSNLKGIDSLGNSPLKGNSRSPSIIPFNIDFQEPYDPVNIVPKAGKPSRKSSQSSNRRRSSRVQKIDFQKLKQSMTQLRQSDEEASQKNFIIGIPGNIPKKRKSNFSISSFGEGNDVTQSNFQLVQNNIIDGVNQQQEESEQSPEAEQKLNKIQKFKSRFRGRLNDIKENPRSYVLLLIVLLLAAGVFISVFVMIPKFVSNYELFSKVYFNLRKLKIFLFKELIKKATQIQLLPDVKASVYSQDFYFIVRDQLTELPDFQQFWKNVYSSNVCPFVDDETIRAQCNGLDNMMTYYGQKVMFQYMQDYIRRKTAAQLFTQTALFMLISRIQAALVTKGEEKMTIQVRQYMQKVKNLQLMMAIVGSVIFFICILLSRKALKDIMLKIKDGQNLLLVMPKNIKKKYIEQMKKNRMKQLTKDLKKDEQKRKNKKRRSQKFNKSKFANDQPHETAIELTGNHSSLIQKQQEAVLKQSLKNSPNNDFIGSPQKAKQRMSQQKR